MVLNTKAPLFYQIIAPSTVLNLLQTSDYCENKAEEGQETPEKSKI